MIADACTFLVDVIEEVIDPFACELLPEGAENGGGINGDDDVFKSGHVTRSEDEAGVKPAGIFSICCVGLNECACGICGKNFSGCVY